MYNIPKPMKKILLQKSLELRAKDIDQQVTHASMSANSIEDKMSAKNATEQHDAKVKVHVKEPKIKKKKTTKQEEGSRTKEVSSCQKIASKTIRTQRKKVALSAGQKPKACKKVAKAENDQKELGNKVDDDCTDTDTIVEDCANSSKTGDGQEKVSGAPKSSVTYSSVGKLDEGQSPTSINSAVHHKDDTNESEEIQKSFFECQPYRQGDKEKPVTNKSSRLRSPYPMRRRKRTEESSKFQVESKAIDQAVQSVMSDEDLAEDDNESTASPGEENALFDNESISFTRKTGENYTKTKGKKDTGTKKVLLNEISEETVFSMADFKEYQKYKAAQQKKKKLPEDEITVLAMDESVKERGSRKSALPKLPRKDRSASRNSDIIGDVVIHKAYGSQGEIYDVEKKVAIVDVNHRDKMAKKSSKVNNGKAITSEKSGSSRSEEKAGRHDKIRPSETKERKKMTSETYTKDAERTRYPRRHSAKVNKKNSTSQRSSRTKDTEKADVKKLTEKEDTNPSKSHEAVLQNVDTPSKVFRIPKLSKRDEGMQNDPLNKPPTESTSTGEKKPISCDVLEDIPIDELIAQSMMKNKPQPFVTHPRDPTLQQIPLMTSPKLIPMVNSPQGEFPHVSETKPLMGSGNTVLPTPTEFSKPPPLWTSPTVMASPTPSKAGNVFGDLQEESPPNINQPETWKPVLLGVVDQTSSIETKEYRYISSPHAKKHIFHSHAATTKLNDSEKNGRDCSVESAKWSSPSLKDSQGKRALLEKLDNDDEQPEAPGGLSEEEPEWVIPLPDLGNLADDFSPPAFSALNVSEVELQLNSLTRMTEETCVSNSQSPLPKKMPWTPSMITVFGTDSPVESFGPSDIHPSRKRTAVMSVQPAQPLPVLRGKDENEQNVTTDPDQKKPKTEYDDEPLVEREEEDWPYVKTNEVQNQCKAAEAMLPEVDGISPYHVRKNDSTDNPNVGNQRKQFQDENQNVSVEPDRNTRGTSTDQPRTADRETQTAVTVPRTQETQTAVPVPRTQGTQTQVTHSISPVPANDERKKSAPANVDGTKVTATKRAPGAEESGSKKITKKQKTGNLKHAPSSEESGGKKITKKQKTGNLKHAPSTEESGGKKITKKHKAGSGLKKAATKMDKLEVARLKEMHIDLLGRNGTRGGWFLGANVQVKGGLHNAVYNAVKIGARAFGMILTSPKAWVSKDLSEPAINKFKTAMQEFRIHPSLVVVQGSPQLNCGSGDPAMLDKSRHLMLEEVRKCEQLDLTTYTMHPGSARGMVNREECLDNIRDSINYILDRCENVNILLENKSGPPHVIGSKFAELGRIVGQIEDQSRVGICLNTRHAFASGYDLRTEEGYTVMMAEIEDNIGRPFVQAMHLSDSTGELGSRRGHPENIGKGEIGVNCFRCLMQDFSNENIPLVLETPGNNFPEEITLLNSLIPDDQ